MLESRQQIQFGYSLDFDTPNTLKALLKRGKQEVVYLCLPEDTTQVDGDCQKRVAGLVPNTIRSFAKTLFWTGLSIATPLLLSWVLS